MKDVTEEKRVDVPVSQFTALQPCPFCGYQDGLRMVVLDRSPGWHCVDCPRCEALGPLGSSAEVATQLWNSRDNSTAKGS